MSLLLADQYPIFMIIVTSAAILFVIQMMRKSKHMIFEKQVKWLKSAACIALLLLVYGYGSRLIMTFIFSIDYFVISFSVVCIMLYDPFVRIVYAIIIFNIFRLGLKILNNFSKLEIFNQQNVAIMNELNRCIMQLLAVRIIFNIIYCLFVIYISTTSSYVLSSMNANFDSIFGILCLFILMLLINTVTTIYTKAVEQYNENSLII